MKKQIGNKLALYPTPVVIIGTMNGDQPTWTLVAHTGIVAHDRLLISLHSAHHINQSVKANGWISVNIVTENYLDKADYCGVVSGRNTDKSKVFDYTMGDNGTPVINDSLLTMECHVEDIYECNNFENFVCSVAATLADESILSTDEKIDYQLLRPVLFEFPTYQYLRTGELIGHCTDKGKEIKTLRK